MEFLNAYHINHYQVLFLDIGMPDMDGFALAKKIRNDALVQPLIIFISTEKDLVYESFDFQPNGFIQKYPKGRIDSEISRAVRNIMFYLSQHKKVLLGEAGQIPEVIPVKQICYILSEGNYLKYVLKDGSCIMVRGKLSDIMEEYKNYSFERIHNRCLANLFHVKKINTLENSVCFTNGDLHKVSRPYIKSFRQQYIKYRIAFM